MIADITDGTGGISDERLDTLINALKESKKFTIDTLEFKKALETNVLKGCLPHFFVYKYRIRVIHVDMSLDVTLSVARPVEVFSANVTHNLNTMARSRSCDACSR